MESSALPTDSRELVAQLFEQLGDTLNLMIESARRGPSSHIFHYRAKALAILGGLDDVLNFESAGDLAQTLRIIYGEATKRIELDNDDSCVERVESAREMILEIRKAWAAIAPFH
jgi:flagellin-specific chaperone FliS